MDDDYCPAKPNVYGKKESAQDAHEAIRPTSLELTPKMVEPFVNRDELKLYTLIWNRFMASQMAPQQNESTTIELDIDDTYTFKATGSRVLSLDLVQSMKIVRKKIHHNYQR